MTNNEMRKELLHYGEIVKDIEGNNLRIRVIKYDGKHWAMLEECGKVLAIVSK